MYFGRYRDDCFSFWKETMEKLGSFHYFLNSLNLHLKFTMEVGSKSICFLNLKISVINGQLFTANPLILICIYMTNTATSHLLLEASRRVQLYVYDVFAVQIMNIHLNQQNIKIILLVEVMIQKEFMIILKKLVKSFEMTQEKRWLIITVTTTELFYQKNLIPEDQMSPK